jgi:flagellar motor switch protein FliG
MSDEKNFPGKEKVANLLIILGKDPAAKIMKYFNEEELKGITYEIVNNRTLDEQERTNIIKEFYHVCLAQKYFSVGGVDYAKEVLAEVMGPQRSMELISNLIKISRDKPFDFIKDVDASEMFNFIQYEADQTVAFILSYLRPSQAAEIMSMLPAERQAEVAIRIALMDRISPEIINEIERVMEKKFSGQTAVNFSKTEGVDVLVDILNSVDRATEKQIFEALERQDEQLVDEVKMRLFVFDDIISLGNKEVQRFLTEVDTGNLAVALKVSTEELKKLIFKNMSQRAGDIVREEMELLGSVRLSEVEEAQQQIVKVIRRLDEEGVIILKRSSGDEIVE